MPLAPSFNISRAYLIDNVKKYYYELLKKCESVIESRRNKLGNKAISDVAYKEAIIEKASIDSQSSEQISYIEKATEDELYKYAFKSHGINIEYLAWYKVKQATEELASGQLYEREVNALHATRESLKDANVSFALRILFAFI